MGNFLGIIISLVPLSIAAAFAFVQVQGLSLVRIILLIVEKNKKPAVRKCGPRAGIQINVKTYFSSQGSAVVRNTAAPETDKLSQLSTLLDEGTDTAHTKLETTETPSAKVEPNVPVDKSRVSVDQTQPEVVAPSVDGIEKPADPPTPIS